MRVSSANVAGDVRLKRDGLTCAPAINEGRQEGNWIVAVGTRLLEGRNVHDPARGVEPQDNFALSRIDGN